MSYVGERNDRQFRPFPAPTEAVVLDPYTLVDLSAEYALPMPVGRPNLSVTFRAANVGDTEYQSVAGYRSPGRAIYFGGRIAY